MKKKKSSIPKLQQIFPFGKVGHRAVMINDIRIEKYRTIIPEILKKIEEPPSLSKPTILSQDTRSDILNILRNTPLSELVSISTFFPDFSQKLLKQIEPALDNTKGTTNFLEQIPEKETTIALAKFNKIKNHFSIRRYETTQLIEVFNDLKNFIAKNNEHIQKKDGNEILRSALKVILKSFEEEKQHIDNSPFMTKTFKEIIELNSEMKKFLAENQEFNTSHYYF